MQPLKLIIVLKNHPKGLLAVALDSMIDCCLAYSAANVGTTLVLCVRFELSLMHGVIVFFIFHPFFALFGNIIADKRVKLLFLFGFKKLFYLETIEKKRPYSTIFSEEEKKHVTKTIFCQLIDLENNFNLT